MARRSKVHIGCRRDGATHVGAPGSSTRKDCRRKTSSRILASVFLTVEINGNLLQHADTWPAFGRWADAPTPDDFVFAVKGPRFHHAHGSACASRKRRWPTSWRRACCGSAGKLGPILWQFPPNFQFDAERLEAFFKLLAA